MRRDQKKKEHRFDTPEEEKNFAIRKAMNLLLYRDRSRAELTDRLREDGLGPEAVEEAVSYVASYGYLNDRRFAETFVASRAERMGQVAIEKELQQKGVSSEIIDTVIGEAALNDAETACRLLKNRAGEPHHLEDGEIRKLTAFLARRGFSSGDIWRAIRHYQSLTDF